MTANTMGSKIYTSGGSVFPTSVSIDDLSVLNYLCTVYVSGSM
jgi:hypothetical protein